jgi:tRNA A37 N6-isopentenylltransferase MiaA
LRGHTSLEQAIAATEIETRQYAKRQLTWFRGTAKRGASKNDARIVWLAGFGSDPAIAEAVLDAVRKFLSA